MGTQGIFRGIILENVNIVDPILMLFSNIHYFEDPMGRLTW